MFAALLLALSVAHAADPVSLAWMEGTWQGGAGEVFMEETWSQARAGNLVGMFRMMEGDQVVFYELMVLETTQGAVTMRLKHFSERLTGWERRRHALCFELREQGPGLALFRSPDGRQTLRYARAGESLEVTLHTPHGEEIFSFQRATPTGEPPATTSPAEQTASPG